MKLYSYFRSSAAYRVRIALNIKGIDYEICPVNLLHSEQKESAYKAINSQGLLPSLVTPDEQTITQSTAILEWLETSYPDTPLLPPSVIDAAAIRSFCNEIACEIHPLNNLRVLKYLQNELTVDDDAKTKWYQHWIKEGFDSLEQQLSNKGHSRFCFGDSPSLADVYLIPQVYNALRFNTDLSDYPRISHIYHECNKLDAFIAAHPDQQTDNPNKDNI